MKKTKNKQRIIIGAIVILCLIIIAFPFLRKPPQKCGCTKITDTNLTVNNEDDAGIAIVYFLGEDFEVIKSESVSKCNTNYYHVNFATKQYSNQSLYVDNHGSVYQC